MSSANRWRFIAACFMLVGSCSLSYGVESAEPRIEQGWIRAPAPGQQAVAVYGRVFLPPGVKLLGVETDAAARVMFHQTEQVDGAMQMREAGMPSMPGDGSPLVLAPGGTHLMLTNLRRALHAGERVELRWRVQSPHGLRTYTLSVPVRPLTAAAPR